MAWVIVSFSQLEKKQSLLAREPQRTIKIRSAGEHVWGAGLLIALIGVQRPTLTSWAALSVAIQIRRHGKID